MSSPAASRPTRPAPLIIGVLLLAVVVASFESTMMYTALPKIIEDFSTNAATASWVLTAFLLVAAASAALCGRLGDVYGRRQVLIVLLAASTVGSIVSIATGTLTGVIVGRAIQGVAGAILPLTFGLARESLPKERVPVAVATIAGGVVLSGAAGTIVAGVLVDDLSWHYIFVVAAVAALLAAVAAVLLPTSQLTARMSRIDWLGAILFPPAIALVLLGISGASGGSWGPFTVGSIVAGLVLLAIWVWWELRVDDPMINIRLFGNRKLSLTTISTFFLAAGPIGAVGFLLLLMMQAPRDVPFGAGLSATAAGTVSFCTSIVGFLLAPVSGRIAARAGARRSLMIGAGFGLLHVLAILFVYNGSLGTLVFSVVFLSVGTSFLLSSLPNLVVESVPAENTSEATGVNQVAQTASTGIGTAVVTLVLSSSVVPGTQFGTHGSYLAVYLIIGVCCVIPLVLAVFMRSARTRVVGSGPVVEAVGERVTEG